MNMLKFASALTLLMPLASQAFMPAPKKVKTSPDETPVGFFCSVSTGVVEGSSYSFGGRKIHKPTNSILSEMDRESGGWSSDMKSIGQEELRITFEKVGDDCQMKVTQVEDKDHNHLVIILPVPADLTVKKEIPGICTMTLDGKELFQKADGTKSKTFTSCMILSDLYENAKNCKNLDGTGADTAVNDAKKKSLAPDTAIGKPKSKKAPGNSLKADDAG
jgi:hypothetical protein